MDSYGSGDDSAAYAGMMAFFIVYFAFIGLMLLLAIALYVVTAIANMRLFRVVGIEPWAAWVPVFNTWRMLELGGHAGWLALLRFVPFGGYVTAVFVAIGMYRTGTAFHKDGSWVVLAIFLPFVWAFLLARPSESYHPEVFIERGWPGPFQGLGARPPMPAAY
jgi:hypothetical protein